MIYFLANIIKRQQERTLKMKYKAVVFDVDGTLIDTRHFIGILQKTYHIMYPQRPSMPYKEFAACYSMTGDMMWEHLNIPPHEHDLMIKCLHQVMNEVGYSTDLFVGMANTLREIHDKGYYLGINTSRISDSLERIIGKSNDSAWDLFSLRITEDLVENPKPAPDSLLLFLEKTQFSKDDVLFVGDSMNDAMCAMTAGCDFAVAGWGEIEGVEREPLPMKYYLRQPKDILKILD